MQIRPQRGEHRDEDDIRQHYLVERELADRLRRAPREQRALLYGQLYDELFKRVPLHPQLRQKQNPVLARRAVRWQFALLRRFIKTGSAFLEVGAGDCTLSMFVCQHVGKVYAGDVSRVISDREMVPPNFRFLLLTGTGVPLPADSVDVAYSNQLLEHLHPEDAMDHLREMHRVLKRGGIYVCVTPNKVGGPWDVSAYFDPEATGFHMKEYTMTEILSACTRVGFRRFLCYGGGRDWYARVPTAAIRGLEWVLRSLPFPMRFRVARSVPARALLGLRVAAVK